MTKYRYVIPEKNSQPIVNVMFTSDETIHWVRGKKKSELITDKEHPELEKFLSDVKVKPDFSKMTVKGLKAYARSHNIDIEGLRLKKQILNRLEETF